MDQATAMLTLDVIGGVAMLLWLAGLAFMLATRRRLLRRDVPEDLPPDLAATIPDGWFVGQAEVEGEPDDLCRRAAAALARGQVAGMPPVRITECAHDQLRFEGTGVVDRVRTSSSRRGIQPIGRVLMRFTAAESGRANILYAVEASAGRWLMRIGGIFLILGFLAVTIGYGLLSANVVHHANPSVRAQVVQMVQAIHFLWPPFLCGGLARAVHATPAKLLETFAHNLPYLNAA